VKREDFERLPLAMQVRVLARVMFDGERLEAINLGRRPFPPRYDMRISRSGGFQWASETDLEGLRFWHKRYRESAQKGGQYAEKDAKRASELERWIAWREWEPETTWHGIRNNEQVAAAPPSSKPVLRDYEPRGGGNSYAEQGGGYSDEEYGAVDDVPFA